MPGGRPANQVNYVDVINNGKQYVVGTVIFNDEDRYFIIDKEDEEKVKGRHWHFAAGNYISSAYQDPSDGKRKEIYLHNFVMNRFGFPGKGAKESIDHINNIGTDNRKENLRLLTQTQQNHNQKQRQRKQVELPADCGILASDIPRNIWYMKPNGSHGARFCIEIKGLPAGDICWKGTSSKNIALKQKLDEAKAKLIAIYAEHGLHQVEEADNKKELEDSYRKIIDLATG